MEIAGYIAAALIGIILGAAGAGGSVLTIPVLVYLFQLPPYQATSYSLFVVGVSSFIGTAYYKKQKLINYKAFIYFGLSSVFTVFIFRKFIIPQLVKATFQLGNFKIAESSLMMVVLAFLVIFSSLPIIKQRKGLRQPAGVYNRLSYTKLLLYGCITGCIAGFLGAGGGFLIVPALILLFNLNIKEAAGTSLLIIATNSTVGFITDLERFKPHWPLLISISALAITGVLAGNILSRHCNSFLIKKSFGWFTLFLGIFILIKELLF